VSVTASVYLTHWVSSVRPERKAGHIDYVRGHFGGPFLFVDILCYVVVYC
jgi:hypothetical protein